MRQRRAWKLCFSEANRRRYGPLASVQPIAASPTIWVNSGAAVQWQRISPVASSIDGNQYQFTGTPSSGSYIVSSANTITLHFAASTGNAFLEIKADCPVNIVVIDQYGQREGADASGNIYDEIAGATYTGAGSDPQIVTLLGDNAGSYTVKVDQLEQDHSP